MRYLLLIKVDPEKPVQPTPALMAAIGALTEEMLKSGKIVDTGGLQAAESGTTMSLHSGKITATDGPYTEANEVVGGYAIAEVASKEEAVALARRFLEVHLEALGASFEMDTEVRRMYTQADYQQPG
jgi:hypothetical protein